MLTVNEALARILALMQPVGTETIPLQEAAGRVLAADAIANRTQPPFAASAMDGYAVIAADLKTGAKLTVIGEAAAGKRFTGSLCSGQAVRIFTGAPVPEGADHILIQEDTERTENTITLKENRDQTPYIRPAGGDFVAGATLSAPKRLTSSDIALLAAMNVPQITVRKRPIIGLIPTGNELVMPGDTPGPDQIISSNNFGLKAMLEACGGTARLLPIASDTAQSLAQVFDLARDCDLTITLGGASVGDHDLVQGTAESQGMDLAFYKVAMRPGKPLMAGMLNGQPLIGLPGNPVSSMVCGHIFIRPALDALLGLPANALPRKTAELTKTLPQNGPREHYMRAIAQNGQVEAFARQDSSLLSVLQSSNALIVRDPKAPALEPGATVKIIETEF